MLRTNGRTPSIKQKILRSLVLLLVVPMTTVTAFAYWKSASMIEQQSLRQFSAVTAMASQQFDQYFRDIEHLSINILRSDLIQNTLRQPYVTPERWTLRQIEEEKSVQHFLSGMYGLKSGIASITLYGSNGMNYFYHPTRAWNHAVEGRSDPFYQQVAAGGGQWVLSGRREESQLTGVLATEPESVVTFGRMIRDLDTMLPLGVVYINVRLEMLQSLAHVKDPDSHLVILDAGGNTVIASTPAAQRVAGEGALQVSTAGPFTQWTSVYVVSRDELFRESKQIRNFIIGVTALALMAALFLANFISAGIVKPLGLLRQKMQRVEQGELDLQITPITHDEVGELTRGFNHMVQRVKELLAEVRNQEQKRMATELQAMQARMNPHFLYNTLNGIRWVALMEGKPTVAEMIASLVYLLQFSARNTARLISVRSELQLLEHYVKLMKMRNDRFDFRVDVDETVLDCAIIPFLLQPIVENALFHGIIPLNANGMIVVRVDREGDHMAAVVRDDGVGMEARAVHALLPREPKHPGGDYGSHIGLANVYQRLKLQFGDQADLHIESEPGRGTAVHMHWPIQLCGEECDSHAQSPAR